MENTLYINIDSITWAKVEDILVARGLEKDGLLDDGERAVAHFKYELSGGELRAIARDIGMLMLSSTPPTSRP